MAFRRRMGSRRLPSFRIKRKLNGWVISFIILVALMFQIVWMVETNLKPMLLVIAKTEVKKNCSRGHA